MRRVTMIEMDRSGAIGLLHGLHGLESTDPWSQVVNDVVDHIVLDLARYYIHDADGEWHKLDVDNGPDGLPRLCPSSIETLSELPCAGSAEAQRHRLVSSEAS